MEAGTLYFYEEYYNTSRLGNRKGEAQGQQRPGSVSGGSGINNSEKAKIVISEASGFRLFNIEAQLPFQFFHKSFIFSFTPMIAFAQSGASIKSGNDVYKEDLESVFYWSAGISYWWTSR